MRSMIFIVIGSYGVTQGAKSASSVTTTRIAAPASTSFRRKSLRTRIAAGLRDGSLPTATATAVLIASVLHARIDDQVQEVDREIDEHIEARDHQQRALDDRIVAAPT